jgi:hypothetical protein
VHTVNSGTYTVSVRACQHAQRTHSTTAHAQPTPTVMMCTNAHSPRRTAATSDNTPWRTPWHTRAVTSTYQTPTLHTTGLKPTPQNTRRANHHRHNQHPKPPHTGSHRGPYHTHYAASTSTATHTTRTPSSANTHPTRTRLKTSTGRCLFKGSTEPLFRFARSHKSLHYSCKPANLQNPVDMYDRNNWSGRRCATQVVRVVHARV